MSVQNPPRAKRPSASEGQPKQAQTADDAAGALKRERTRLLSLEEHLRTKLQLIEDEIDSPATRELIEAIREGSDGALPEELAKAGRLVKEAIEVLRDSEAYLRSRLDSGPNELEIEGIGTLPVRLARFITERRDLPGFSYEVIQDEVRGWIIQWKEYGEGGVVRGSGQFYERPYAWLDE